MIINRKLKMNLSTKFGFLNFKKQKIGFENILKLTFFLVVFSFSIAFFIDSNRSFLNVNKESDLVFSVSTIFNPIKDSLRESIAISLTRSISLIIFFLFSLFSSFKIFLEKDKDVKKIIFGLIYLFFSLLNLILYFALLLDKWKYVFILCCQIYLFLILDYVKWWIFERQNFKINYEYNKIFILKQVKYLSLLSIVVIFGSLFATMVFKFETVSYNNDIINWFENLIAELATTKNSAILTVLIITFIFLVSLVFAPQIYFYKTTLIYIKNKTKVFSILFYFLLSLFIYAIYVYFAKMKDFELYLVFGENLKQNFLPIIIISSIYAFLLLTFLCFLYIKKIFNKLSEYKLAIFLVFIFCGFLIGYLNSFQNLNANLNLIVNIISLFYFLILYFLFIRKSNIKITNIGKFFCNVVIFLFFIFNFLYLFNIHLYVDALLFSKANNKQISLIVFTTNSIDHIYPTLLIISFLIIFLVLGVEMSKNIVLLGHENKTLKNKNVKR